MQNNLPKIPATEVPAHFRPLMSCALWRLHESIDRNDLNQLFCLTNQEEICIIAKKLNITARSCKELGQKIAASTVRLDLNDLGMLEKEGLVKSKDEVKTVVPEEPVRGVIFKDSSGRVSLANHELQSDGGQAIESDHARHGDDSLKVEASAPQVGPSNGFLDSETPHEATQGEKLASDPAKHAAKEVIDPRALVQSILNNPSGQVHTGHTIAETKVEDVTPTQQGARDREETVQVNEDPTTPDQKKLDPPLLIKQTAKSPVRSANLPVTVAQDDPDDSDEEVVVFVPNPKRMSAQKRAAASTSRPTTAHGHPVIAPKTDSPKIEAAKDPNVHRTTENGSSRVQAVPHNRQRPLSSDPGLYDPEQGPAKMKAVPHGHPRPLSSGPTVIDPNAFGRGLAVNPTPGVLANVGASRRSRQHSPRTSVQGPTLNANRSAQSSPQASPPRHKAVRSPRRSPRATPHQMEDPQPTTVPVISHQAFTRAPLVAPNAKNNQKSRFGPIGPPSKSPSNLESSIIAAEADTNGDKDLLQAPIQRPKSSNGQSNRNGHAANFSHHHSPRSNPPDGSTPLAPDGQQSQRTVKKSLFEPEFDRTGAQPTAEPQPKGIKMQEVQYTLKSGMTREAARGKGKLWVG